ncbi:antA/AntB antirepressor family protein [Mannheimia haemolytica]
MTAEKSSATQLTEFLPIVTQRHQGEIKQLVDGRQLWQFLESKQHFADWIIKAIEAGFFERNKDYFTFHKIMNRKLGVRGASKADSLLLDMGIDHNHELKEALQKHLIRQRKNPQEKRYFINESKLIDDLTVGGSIKRWKEQNHVKSKPRDYFSLEQLEIVKELEKADCALLELDIPYQERKKQLIALATRLHAEQATR